MTLELHQPDIPPSTHPTTRIKICGVSRTDDIDVAAEAGANGVGFVRAKKSARYIEFEQARILLEHMPSELTSVAVYVDAPTDEIIRLRTDAVQLHGQEDEETVQLITDHMPQALVIKGFPFSRPHLNRWQETAGVHAVLVDGRSAGGGMGFDYEPLVNVRHTLTRPLILAGGLTPDNVGDAITLIRPYAVDVSSGVESEPGVKDHGAIRAFCQAVREADQLRYND